MNEEYLAVKDVARMFRVSTRTIARWINAGYIHPVRFGATLRLEKRRLLLDVEKLQSHVQKEDSDPIMG